MKYEMMDMLTMKEQEKEQKEYNDWLDKVQRRDELINKIDLKEIDTITAYWKPEEAVRFLSNILTSIVGVK